MVVFSHGPPAAAIEDVAETSESRRDFGHTCTDLDLLKNVLQDSSVQEPPTGNPYFESLIRKFHNLNSLTT